MSEVNAVRRIVRCNVGETAPEEQLRVLDRDGVLILRGALSAPVTRAAVDFGTAISEQAIRAAETHSVADDYGHNPGLLRPAGLERALTIPELLLPPSVAPLIEAIFQRTGSSGTSAAARRGGRFQTPGMAAHILLPGAEARPLHRDVDHIFDDPELPVFSLAMHLPVTEFSSRTGGTRIAPGSHRSESPVRSTFRPIWDVVADTVDAGPGDVFLFDNRVWHAAGANVGDAPRVMLSVVFAAEWFGSWDTAVNASIYDELPTCLRSCVRRGPPDDSAEAARS